MKKSFPKFMSAAAAAGILSLTLAACSGSAPAGSSSSAPAPSSSAASSSVPASSSAPATSAPATSSSAAAGSASTGTAAGANVCKKALDAFTGATTDMSSMTGSPTKMVETLNKAAADLNAIADEASDPTQKAAIQEMGKYWSDVSAASAAKDTKKIQEIVKAATAKDGKLMKATATVAKCSV